MKNQSTRVVVAIAAIVVALAFYFVLLGQRGIALIQDGRAVPVVLGIAVATIRSGLAHQHLARRMHDEGLELDVDDLPRRPSGRIERDAADELFAQVKQEWEADPDNWRNSYRLARAYDYAGDRGRARETMRRAVALEKHERES